MRKYERLLYIILVMVQLLLAACLSAAETPPDTDRAHEFGVQAYIYAYPMVLMEVTRQVSTNVAAPSGSRAPMNQFAHRRAFPDHTFRKVVRPNADTLYSILWFDVADEPQIISSPDTAGRYFLWPALDMWTDVFAAPGSRTTGTKAANFAIVGPEWTGSLPQNVERIRSPTTVGWIIGRTQTNGATDYENVHKVQDGFQVTPLSQWGKSPVRRGESPVRPDIDPKASPPAQVDTMSAKKYFTLFTQLLKQNPPHELDWSMVAQLKHIGIVPGQEFDFDNLDEKMQQALDRAVVDGQKMIVSNIRRTGVLVNGWRLVREGIGNYGTSYLQRASVARTGLGANVPEDAIYLLSQLESDNATPYNGSNPYRLHFPAGEIPPANAFWSLAMYDEDAYFVDNAIQRYSIGDRDALRFNEDGSLDIYIQHGSPGADRESNWLPAPKGNFDLILRLYWPKTAALTGEWSPPRVQGVK